MATLQLGYFTINDKSHPDHVLIKGSRVSLRKVLEALAEGMSKEEVVKTFPDLVPTDVSAAIAWAAGVALDELPLERTGEMPVFE